MTEQSVQNLVKKFFRNECTSEEKEQLARWIDQSATDFILKRMLEDAWRTFEPLEKMPDSRSTEILSTILNEHQESEPLEVPVRHMWFRKVAVAAIIAVIFGTGSFYLFFNHSSPDIAKVVKTQPSILNDAYPGHTKAVLTLADGSTITLDTSANGTITHQGATEVISRKGELVYNSTGDNSQGALFNSLHTHQGELFPLLLSDGTRVWLNSASSIHFPVAFNGPERIVDITGEAYFEVAKNPAKPFKVRLNGMETEVLGTHFDINGYSDEPVVKTTLIEGSLRVTKGGARVLLSPGQQARLKANGNIELVKNVDPDEAISWTNGYFHFNKASLENVMRQLSRWYDVEVEYEGKHTAQDFSGDIPKNIHLSEALKNLEYSQVYCKIVGKKVVVLPEK